MLDQADLGKFLVRLVNLGQQRTARHRDHRVPGRAPAELFGDLKTHRLGTFRVVRAQVDVDETPTVLARDLRAQAVDLIIRAMDADDVGAVHQRAEHLAAFQVGGDEHIAFQPGGGGLRGDGVGQVARRGAGNGFQPEFACTGQRHGDNPVLEGKGGVINRVVLDVEFAQAQPPRQSVGADQRREAHLRARRSDRRRWAAARGNATSSADGP